MGPPRTLSVAAASATNPSMSTPSAAASGGGNAAAVDEDLRALLAEADVADVAYHQVGVGATCARIR
jgi:hypothetical protein